MINFEKINIKQIEKILKLLGSDAVCYIYNEIVVLMSNKYSFVFNEHNYNLKQEYNKFSYNETLTLFKAYKKYNKYVKNNDSIIFSHRETILEIQLKKYLIDFNALLPEVTEKKLVKIPKDLLALHNYFLLNKDENILNGCFISNNKIMTSDYVTLAISKIDCGASLFIPKEMFFLFEDDVYVYNDRVLSIDSGWLICPQGTLGLNSKMVDNFIKINNTELQHNFEINLDSNNLEGIELIQSFLKTSVENIILEIKNNELKISSQMDSESNINLAKTIFVIDIINQSNTNIKFKISIRNLLKILNNISLYEKVAFGISNNILNFSFMDTKIYSIIEKIE